MIFLKLVVWLNWAQYTGKWGLVEGVFPPLNPLPGGGEACSLSLWGLRGGHVWELEKE